MTQGNLAAILIRFSIPLVLSGILQQMYAWADAFIVGNLVGETALAAIGATTALSNLFVMIITGLTLGVSILTAQMWGRGERGGILRLLSTFVVVMGAVFLVIGLAGSLTAGWLLEQTHTPEDIIDMSRQYLRIVMLGLPFMAVYNVYAAVLRGMGESKAPFYAVLVACLVNVGLDLLLVGPLNMAVQGAAAATVAAQGMMAVFILVYAKRGKGLQVRGEKLVDVPLLKQGALLGLPMAIQSSINSLGSVVLQNFMNGFGSTTVAAITTAYRVDSVILLPVINLSAGISTVTAQNVGARKHSRAKRGLLVGTGIMTAVSVVLAVLVVTVGGDLIAMFGVTEASTNIGRVFFRNIGLFYPIYGLAMSLRGYLEGLGDVLWSSAIGIGALGLRIVLSYGLADLAGNQIIAWAEAASWCAMLVLFAVRYIWKNRAAAKNEN